MAHKLCSVNPGEATNKKTFIDILETITAQTLEVRKKRGAESKKSVIYLAHSFAEPFQCPIFPYPIHQKSEHK